MKTIFYIILFVTVNLVYSQQLSQFSQYVKNQSIINPAAAGVYDFIDVRILGRSQWSGIINAPMSSNIYFIVPISTSRSSSSNQGIGGAARESQIGTGKVKHAAGGQIFSDQYGAFRRTSINGTYAIHLPINKKLNMSFGTQIGISNNSFLVERAQVLNSTTDQTYSESVTNLSSKNNLNVGAGFYLYSKTMFAGISASQITKNMIDFGQGTTFFNPKMHFNITGGMKMKINREMSITPSILMKYMFKSPLSVEASAMYSYKDWIWTSLSFRIKDAIVVGAGCNLSKRFRVGYSYDLTVSKMRNFSSGTHEIMVGIMLDKK